nr:2Fe-2S iron-sulfur cluster-binding protein [uncultured Dyadobacter sp.]
MDYQNQITFSLIFEGQQYPVKVTAAQYFSLMTVIADVLPITGFGLCSGMGSCGTCTVQINGRKSLSCELAVNESLENALIHVSEA